MQRPIHKHHVHVLTRAVLLPPVVNAKPPPWPFFAVLSMASPPIMSMGNWFFFSLGICRYDKSNTIRTQTDSRQQQLGATPVKTHRITH